MYQLIVFSDVYDLSMFLGNISLITMSHICTYIIYIYIIIQNVQTYRLVLSSVHVPWKQIRFDITNIVRLLSRLPGHNCQSFYTPAIY